ncbi:MAG TPA: hypothetical protein VHY83_14355 [Solirubrobacteraceae bacterium]|nr:hypothetical protein [Solirubrobacteraceae bacterium]
MTGLLNEMLAEQRTQELLRDARNARDRAPARDRLRTPSRLATLLGRRGMLARWLRLA